MLVIELFSRSELHYVRPARAVYLHVNSYRVREHDKLLLSFETSMEIKRVFYHEFHLPIENKKIYNNNVIKRFLYVYEIYK